MALDLETTGLDSKTDRIIEIGAVRFANGKAGEEYSTFVNPGMPVPEHITRLTGITSEQVAPAPAFRDIAGKLIEFIADMPLCGHQIDFDINFLNEEFKRISLPKVFLQQIDTALISRIVNLPVTRYTLGSVARALGVPLENAHRALDDARASGMAALALLPKLAQIPVATRAVMAHAAPPSVVKHFLVKSLEKESYSLDLTPPVLPRAPKKLSPEDPPRPVDAAAVTAAFEAGGSLSQAMKGFAARPSQTRMAAAVAVGVQRQHLPRGRSRHRHGKVAGLFSACRPVRARQQLPCSGVHPHAQPAGPAHFQGPASCQEGRGGRPAVFGAQGTGQLPVPEPVPPPHFRRARRFFVPRTHGHAAAYKVGAGDPDRRHRGAERIQHRWYSRVWRSISSEAHFCEGRRCKEYACCFLQQARQRALGSHIVVINHALFYSEICAESSFLGKIGPIVFDEAHHIEECGHRFLRTEADSNRLGAFLDTITNLEKEIAKAGEGRDAPFTEKEFKPLVKRLRAEVKAFLDFGLAWARSKTPPSPEFQLDMGPDVFSQSGAAASLDSALADLQDCLRRYGQLCETEACSELVKSLHGEILSAGDTASQLRADLSYLCAAGTDDHVFWAEGNLAKGWIKLLGVPLDIGAILASIWEKNAAGMVFTSATLSVCGSMEYFERKAGLLANPAVKTAAEVFESPFVASQAVRCGVRSAPAVESPDYPAYAAGAITEMLAAFDKNILALFTSNAMLAAVYERLRQQVSKNDCTILAQGFSGNRQAILDEFRHTRRAVLLGADSFWEGIDVPGKACEIVVIARLPFPVPTHPLTRALCRKCEEETGESFMAYSVPEAIIRFRQGTGRLIRSHSDRGALVVLDNRMFTKGYGARFASCLDGGFEQCADLPDLLRRMRAFFANETAPALTYVPYEDA